VAYKAHHTRRRRTARPEGRREERSKLSSEASTGASAPRHRSGSSSPTVGAPPAIANAIVDAMWHLGVRHLDIPITPQKVWRAPRKHGVTD
jgi:hypothetical protein